MLRATGDGGLDPVRSKLTPWGRRPPGEGAVEPVGRGVEPRALAEGGILVGHKENGPEPSAAVLVIEDDALSRKLVCDLLAASGFDVLGAETAEEGLAIARRKRLSLVVTDINLPGLDGIGVMRRLRGEELTARIPVLAITGLTTVGQRRRVLATEFDGYLTKPIRVGDLLAAVRRLAGRPSRPS